MATRYFYLDASALAKRYAPEPGAAVIHHLFSQLTPSRMVVLNVGIAEVASILTRKRNARLITPATFDQALLDFRAEIINQQQLRKVVPTTALVVTALPLITRHSINATNAILLRSASDLAVYLRSGGDDLVLAASDQS